MLGDLVKDWLRLVDQICHARADLMSIGTLGCQRAVGRLRLVLHGVLVRRAPGGPCWRNLWGGDGLRRSTVVPAPCQEFPTNIRLWCLRREGLAVG